MNRRRFRMNRRMWGINPRSIGMFDVHFGTCRADYLDDCFEERNFWHMRRHACTGGFWYDDGNRNCVLRDTDYNGRFTGNHNSNIHNNDNSVEMMDNRNVNVFRNSNSGANSNGTDNNGRITDNRNSYINYEESSVEIVDNRNVFIDIVRSTVKVIDQSNCKLLATASNIEMRSNSNVNVEADDAWCKFEDNNNLDYKGTGGASEFQSKFVDNRNCDIGGKNNNILASNNNNLSVAGDDNHLEISRTRNHNVQSTPLGSNENTFTVSSSGRSSIQFDISYAGAAVINERKYLLGIFGFDVVTGFDRVNVTLTGDDGVTYSVVNSSPMKVVLQAEKNDVVQTLELCGERVETVTTNSINIFVNSM